jgi:hypothetical protein
MLVAVALISACGSSPPPDTMSSPTDVPVDSQQIVRCSGDGTAMYCVPHVSVAKCSEAFLYAWRHPKDFSIPINYVGERP